MILNFVCERIIERSDVLIEREKNMDIENKKKSLYIHIPFCERKCFYCSFAVTISRLAQADVYLDCLAEEAGQHKGTLIKSIYIGGGTPTLLNGGQLQKLARRVIRDNFVVDDRAEFSIEANPEGLDSVKLAALRDLGVNRISLGVQSLNDHHLRYLGRNHGSGRAQSAYQLIRKSGFHNVSVDLMFSLPGQTRPQLRDDIEKMLDWDSQHISLYSLTIEKNSRFYAQKIEVPPDTQQEENYNFIEEELSRRGYRQYEVSNYAKPGFESKHNLNYWRGGEYTGLGMGAHSYRDGRRFWNVANLNGYLERIRNHESPVDGGEKLTLMVQFKERVLFGLRMNQGVNLEEAEGTFGYSFSAEQHQRLEMFVEGGLLLREGPILKASRRGRLVLDEICSYLI